MTRVRDIMTAEVITVSSRARLDHAAWSLSAKGVSGAPVCDAQGALVGVLSRSDLIDADSHSIVPGDTPVAEVMSTEVWSVHPDAPASDAVELMVDKKVHRLPVLDSGGALVGIITSMDVMRAIVGGFDLGPKHSESMRQPGTA